MPKVTKGNAVANAAQAEPVALDAVFSEPVPAPAMGGEVGLRVVGQKDARTVTIGSRQLYFSYRTLMAVTGPEGGLRIPNTWGRMTQGHLNAMGVAKLPAVDADALVAALGVTSVGLDGDKAAQSLRLGRHQLFFSYETLVGYDGPLGTWRVEGAWTRSTNGHLQGFGLAKATPIPADELKAILIGLVLP
jgi:hypothetical protein